MNSDPVAKWEEILRSHYWDDLLQLAGSNHNKSIHVRFFELERWDPELSRELLEWPEQILGAARAALQPIDLPADISLDGVQVRIIDLPVHSRLEQKCESHRAEDQCHGLPGVALPAQSSIRANHIHTPALQWSD